MEVVPSLQKLIRGLPLPLPLVLLVLRGNLLLEHVSMVQYDAIQCSGPGDMALDPSRSLPGIGLCLGHKSPRTTSFSARLRDFMIGIHIE
jgi:hypothetical protein